MAVVVAQQLSLRLRSKTLEVVDLNPARCRAFCLASVSDQFDVLNAGPSQRWSTTDLPIKKA